LPCGARRMAETAALTQVPGAAHMGAMGRHGSLCLQRLVDDDLRRPRHVLGHQSVAGRHALGSMDARSPFQCRLGFVEAFLVVSSHVE